MRSLFGLFSVGAVLLVSAAAQAATVAATVQPTQGQLSLNQGQGFHAVKGAIAANVGDSVMVSPDGAATVVYADGCKVDVQPGAVVNIAPLSPCASGSYAQTNHGDDYLQAAVGGALFLGGVGAGIYGITQANKSSGSNSPASP